MFIYQRCQLYQSIALTLSCYIHPFSALFLLINLLPPDMYLFVTVSIVDYSH